MERKNLKNTFDEIIEEATLNGKEQPARTRIKLAEYIKDVYDLSQSKDTLSYTSNIMKDKEVVAKKEFIRIIVDHNKNKVEDYPIMITEYINGMSVVSGCTYKVFENLNENFRKKAVHLKNIKIRMGLNEIMREANEKVKLYKKVFNNLKDDKGNKRTLKELAALTGLSESRLSYLRRYFEKHGIENIEKAVMVGVDGISEETRKEIVEKADACTGKINYETIALELGFTTPTIVKNVVKKRNNIREEVVEIKEDGSDERLEKLVEELNNLKDEKFRLKVELKKELQDKKSLSKKLIASTELAGRLEFKLESLETKVNEYSKELERMIEKVKKYENASFFDRLRGVKY